METEYLKSSLTASFEAGLSLAIERAKELLLNEQMTCSEIGWKLNYSSIAHFSAQFKSVTGLTPTAFQRIMNKRKLVANAEQSRIN